jgi:ornithine carbamoyltransferase
MSTPRHFLDLDALDAAVLRDIIETAKKFKAGKIGNGAAKPLAGKTLAMIFERPSTRTRVSFEVAMKQLGGDAVVLTPTEMQIGRGETLADTARVLSRYVDAVMIRIIDAERLRELARHASVPVINGLTSTTHPCQLLADVMTFEEHCGPIRGRVVAWSGDGNNMTSTWIQAAAQFEFELRVACPKAKLPAPEILAWARKRGAKVSVGEDAEKAVRGADCVVTDTWVSMGQKPSKARHNQLAPFRVDDRLMSLAKPDAVFMHCLPAHREEEVTASVLDGPRSVVWDEAENRLHAQKGILTWCLAP